MNSEVSAASPIQSWEGRCGQSVSVAVVQVVSCTEHLAEGVSQGHHPPGTELNLPEKRVFVLLIHTRAPCSPAAAQSWGALKGPGREPRERMESPEERGGSTEGGGPQRRDRD